MKIAFHASRKPRAQKALEELKGLYGQCEPAQAEAIVILGGDGAMLRALHEYGNQDIPVFGMNLGTLGFLLNPYALEGLPERLKSAKSFRIHPLLMETTDKEGSVTQTLAYNEVSLLRETHSSAKLSISINGKERLPMLVCDGIIVSTPVGSTAYNSSAGGPIVPLDANVLPVTPISAFRPRRWPGALVSCSAVIDLEVLRPVERPVSATADSTEIRNVRHVRVSQAVHIAKTLLYDPGNPLEERIFQEQFPPEEQN